MFDREIYLIAKYDIYLVVDDVGDLCKRQTYIDGLPILQTANTVKMKVLRHSLRPLLQAELDNDTLVLMYDDAFVVYSLTEKRVVATKQILYPFETFKLVPSLRLLLTSTDN